MTKLKYLVLSVLLLLLSFVSTFATQVTVSASTLSNWRYGTANVALRVYASDNFVASTGATVMGSPVGSGGFYKIIGCTVNSGVVTIPAFTIDSTTDGSDKTHVSYTFIFYEGNTRRDIYYKAGLRIPPATPTTFGSIILYNSTIPLPPETTTYTTGQINTLLASGNAAFAITQGVLSSSSYSELCAAVTAIGSTNTTLALPVTLSATSNCTLPATLELWFVNKAGLINTNGNTITINSSFGDPGLRQLFTGGGTVILNKTDIIRPEWFGADATDAIDDTAAIVACVTTAVQSGYKGKIQFSGGRYLTTGNIVIPWKTHISGVSGNTLDYGTSTGQTTIVLTNPNNAVFSLGEAAVDVTFEKFQCRNEAVGTNETKCLSFRGGNIDNFSAQVFKISEVLFYGFKRGIEIVALDVSKFWQVSYVQMDHCTFLNNTQAGIWVETGNNELNISDTKFHQIAGSHGIYAEKSGTARISRSWSLGPAEATPICTAVGGAPGYAPTYNTLMGESFITINGQHGTWTIEDSLTENTKYFLVNNFADLAQPITLLGNAIGDIRLNAATHLVSIGNTMFVNTVEATAGASRIYSFGDKQQTGHKCIGAGTGNGFILNSNAILVTQSQTAGFNIGTPLAVGRLNSVADSSEGTDSEGMLKIGVTTNSKPYLQMGRTTSGVYDFSYLFTRNGTNGYLGILGSQGNPFTGLELNGPLEFGTGIGSVSQSGANRGTLYYDSSDNSFRTVENTTIKFALRGPTSLAANAITKHSTLGNLTASSLTDDGSNILWSGLGLLQFGGTSTSFPALQRSTNRIGVYLADGSALAGLFSSNLSTGTILDSNNNTAIQFTNTASAVNYWLSRNGAAGSPATVGVDAFGASTNINFNIVSKGTGVVQANGAEVTTAANTTTFSNKSLDVEATGNNFTDVISEYWAAAGCNNTTAGPVFNLTTSLQPSPVCNTISSHTKGVLDFPDLDGLYQAHTEYLLPTGWTGVIDVKFRYYNVGTTGNTVWQVQTRCIADGEVIGGAFNAASTVTDAVKGTTLQMNDATIGSITTTGCAAGEMLELIFGRDRTHASDTATGVVSLMGVEFTFRRAK